MATKKRSYGKKKTPVTYRGRSVQGDSVKHFMEEWSRLKAEEEHVETIEEANDFEIYDEDEVDFFEQGLTVYEMHEMAEENLALLDQPPSLEPEAESNETGDQGASPESPPSHAQSAPVEQNPPPSQE